MEVSFRFHRGMCFFWLSVCVSVKRTIFEKFAGTVSVAGKGVVGGMGFVC